MNTKDAKQSGFGMVIGVIAIILVVGLIGFIVWRLYSQSNTQANNATSNNSSTSQPSKESTNTKTATPQPTYLDIKELGIKIALNSQISDAIYKTIPTTDGSKVVGISAQSLIDKSADCDASKGTLGLIEATTTAPTYMGGQKPLPVDNTTLFKFGTTYYQYISPQNQGCLTDNQTDINMVADKVNAFTESFKTVQPDN